MFHLVNKYMDEYLADHNNLSAKAKKYMKQNCPIGLWLYICI